MFRATHWTVLVSSAAIYAVVILLLIAMVGVLRPAPGVLPILVMPVAFGLPVVFFGGPVLILKLRLEASGWKGVRLKAVALAYSSVGVPVLWSRLPKGAPEAVATVKDDPERLAEILRLQ